MDTLSNITIDKIYFKDEVVVDTKEKEELLIKLCNRFKRCGPMKYYEQYIKEAYLYHSSKLYEVKDGDKLG